MEKGLFEEEPLSVDISDRVRAIFICEDPRLVSQLKRALKKDIKTEPFVTFIVDYTTLDQAR